jgi:hypothetical protein
MINHLWFRDCYEAFQGDTSCRDMLCCVCQTLRCAMLSVQSLVISHNRYLPMAIILLRGESHEFSKRVDVGVYHAIRVHRMLNENSK